MATRERPRSGSSSRDPRERSPEAPVDRLSDAELNEISEDELDTLFSASPKSASNRFGRIAMATGIGMMLVLTLFLVAEFTTLSFLSPEIGAGLVAFMAAIIGFGVFSGQRKKNAEPDTSRSSGKAPSDEELDRKLQEKIREARAALDAEQEASGDKERGLRRSSDKKLLGVCSGLGEYFGLDVTLVRAAFLIGLFVSSGSLLFVYFGLAYIMPGPDDT